MATKIGRSDGRHAGSLSGRETVAEGLSWEKKGQIGNAEGWFPKRDKGGEIPDTIPMLTSTAVQVEEPMKSHVTSVDEV